MDDFESNLNTKIFSLKLLTTIFELQIGDTKSRSGVRFNDIVHSIVKKFETDGDIDSQVLISLRQLTHKGFISKTKNKYKLVGPMARVLLLPHKYEERKKKIKRIQKIFLYKVISPNDSNVHDKVKNAEIDTSNREDNCINRPAKGSESNSDSIKNKDCHVNNSDKQ